MSLGGCFRAPHRLQPSHAKSLGGRSEASACNHSEAGSGAAGAGAPPPELSQLVRRKISLPQPLFARLDAQEKADRLLAQGPRGRWSSCCLPVLSPTSRAYAWWALLILLLDLTYTAIFCPVSVAFAPRDHLVNWAFIVDFVAGALFCADVVFNFSCGYVITHGMRQQVVLRRAGVARIYVTKGTFLVDALSSAAWFAQVAVVILSWSGSDPTEHIELAHALRVARILRILRVLRLVKQLYLSHMGGAKRLLGLRPHTLHCLQLLYVAGVIVNFCGCIFFFSAREHGFEGSWVSRYNPFVARYSADGSSPLTSEEAESIPAGQLWLAAVYWASTTILTVGYGDIVPWNALETAVTLGVQLLGIMFFGALLSSIASIIQRASKAARRGQALQDKLASIEQYMREQRVPRDVRRRVKRYYSDVWLEQQDGLDVPAFYAELPHTLRTDMAAAIAAPALERLACFQVLKQDTGAGRALAARLQPLQLPPGMTLCEEGDEAVACWVLQEGTVSLSSHREEDQQEEEELVEGPALLGEAALLGPSRGFPCHLATLRTLTRCTLWRLDAADVGTALRMHPQVLEAIRTVLLHGSPPAPSHMLKAQTSGREGSLQIYVDASAFSGSLAAEQAAAAAAAAAAVEGEGVPGPEFTPQHSMQRRGSNSREGGGGSTGRGSSSGLRRLAAGTSSIAEAELGTRDVLL